MTEVVARDSLPDGIHWYASRKEFVVRKLKGSHRTETPKRFRVKKTRVGFEADAVEEQRNAAIAYWSSGGAGTVSTSTDHYGGSSPSHVVTDTQTSAEVSSVTADSQHETD